MTKKKKKIKKIKNPKKMDPIDDEFHEIMKSIIENCRRRIKKRKEKNQGESL